MDPEVSYRGQRPVTVAEVGGTVHDISTLQKMVKGALYIVHHGKLYLAGNLVRSDGQLCATTITTKVEDQSGKLYHLFLDCLTMAI